MMLLYIIGAAINVISLAQASPKVFPVQIYKKLQTKLTERQHDVSITLNNVIAHAGYYADLSIGTPPQPVTVLVDTGSADLWMLGPGVCTSDCYGGEYDHTKSSSSAIVQDASIFNLSYADGSSVVGEYIQDTIQLGSATMTSAIFAEATSVVDNYSGIMGISFNTSEAIIVNDGYSTPYSNIIDNLVMQGIINTRAYSLYLDDREQATGTLLFGGYDTDKYTGELTALSLQPDVNSGIINSMTVVLSAIGITTSNGTKKLTSDAFTLPVILDSGTTFTTLPQEVFNAFVELTGGQLNKNGVAIVNCDIGQESASIDFQFGGDGGPIIQVPLSEYILPRVTQSGEQFCILGMQSNPGDETLFGDTFLRSAYVVYDMENQMIYIAQTNFDSTSSNIQEIGLSGPSVVALTATASAPQTGTFLPGNGAASTIASANPVTAAASVEVTGNSGGLVISSTVQRPGATGGGTAGSGATASSSSAGSATGLGGSHGPITWMATIWLSIPVLIVGGGMFL